MQAELLRASLVCVCNVFIANSYGFLATLTADTCCFNKLPANISGCTAVDICQAGSSCCQTLLNTSGAGAFQCCNPTSACVPVPSPFPVAGTFTTTSQTCVPTADVCNGIVCSPGYNCVPDLKGRPKCILNGTCCFPVNNGPCAPVDICANSTTCCTVTVDSNNQRVSNGSICCQSWQTCFPNPVGGSSINICANTSDPCSGINCGTNLFCRVSSGQPICDKLPAPVRFEVTLTSSNPGTIGSAVLLLYKDTNTMVYTITYSGTPSTPITAALSIVGGTNSNFVLNCCANPISGNLTLTAADTASVCSGTATNVITLFGSGYTLSGSFSCTFFAFPLCLLATCPTVTCANTCNGALCAPTGTTTCNVSCPAISTCYNKYALACEAQYSTGLCAFTIADTAAFNNCANSSCPGITRMQAKLFCTLCLPEF